MSSIFLSHNHADKAFARRLTQNLEQTGIRVWLDEAELMIGDSLIEKIREGIDAMEYLGGILSPNSVESPWVQREVDIAMNQEIKGKRIKVLPLVIENCELPGFLEGKLYADFRDPMRYEEELAKVLRRLGNTLEEPAESSITNNLGMEFVFIPAGKFIMGSSSEEIERLVQRYGEESRIYSNRENPQHPVTISQPFYLGKYEVTQGEWQAVMGNNPSYFTGDPNRPVENVSWNDVQAFIGKLNEQDSGRTYQLPTEAEWEYACRAGTTTEYSFGDDPGQLGEYAWYDANDGRTTHPVGQLKPNPWGLYDIHGNVWEWVQDRYGDYPSGAVTNPQGPLTGDRRVLRGSALTLDQWFARCTVRNSFGPRDRDVKIGFRVVLLP